MKIALLGTRGVPARYGGFETAVEEVGSRLALRGHEVAVYCRNPDQRISHYRGMRLRNIPAIRRRELETLSHSFLSAIDLWRWSPDVAVVFNAANAPILPLVRVPKAVHVDGIEWRRAKWQGNAARYLRWSEKVAVRLADVVIADARGIQQYLMEEYRTDSVFIPYGAPVIERDQLAPPARPAAAPGAFHLVVARLEPENSVDMIIDGYRRSNASLPLVVIGDNPYSTVYVLRLRRKLQANDVLWLGSIWDQNELDWYYANCLTYVHGHTVGGTNPSLLRAMGAGAAVVARDGIFNREVAGTSAAYFRDSDTLADALQHFESATGRARAVGAALKRRACDCYSWDAVATEYERLCVDLAGAS